MSERTALRRYRHTVGWRFRPCWHPKRFGWCLICWRRLLTGRTRRDRRAIDERLERIRNCQHANRRPNPQATAVLDRNPQVCLDCGTGLLGYPTKGEERAG